MTFNFCYHGVSDCTALFRFDPTIGQDMLAVLQMKGPRINNNASLNDVIDNVHLYNMFCKLLKIEPASNNGTMQFAHRVLI